MHKAMKIFIWQGFLLCSMVVYCTKGEEPSCGRLIEQFLYKPSANAAPTEFPWVGHIKYVVDKRAACLATLISKRNLITPAHCIAARRNEPNTIRIRLGSWEVRANHTEYICNRGGYCVPPPKDYDVQSIKVHPYYDESFNNNIALITLTEDVKFTNYIQPICLPNKTEATNSLGKYYYVGGFREEHSYKTKTTVVGISRLYCDENYAFLGASTSTQYCVFQDLNGLMNSGSAVMAMNIVNDKPTSFYLIGYLVQAATNPDRLPPVVDIVQDIGPYVDWIKTNMIK